MMLLGDAAHAVVPFYGQGMNAAFEDAADLIATLSAEQVADVLTYHAAAGRALAGDLSDGQTIPTVLGEDITVIIDRE